MLTGARLQPLDATNKRPMASVRARTPRAQPPTSTERGLAARARPWWLVLLACCRGVWAAGGTSQLDPALAIQCREPVIAGGKEGKALIVSAQRPSSVSSNRL